MRVMGRLIVSTFLRQSHDKNKHKVVSDERIRRIQTIVTFSMKIIEMFIDLI